MSAARRAAQTLLPQLTRGFRSSGAARAGGKGELTHAEIAHGDGHHGLRPGYRYVSGGPWRWRPANGALGSRIGAPGEQPGRVDDVHSGERLCAAHALMLRAGLGARPALPAPRPGEGRLLLVRAARRGWSRKQLSRWREAHAGAAACTSASGSPLERVNSSHPHSGAASGDRMLTRGKSSRLKISRTGEEQQGRVQQAWLGHGWS